MGINMNDSAKIIIFFFYPPFFLKIFFLYKAGNPFRILITFAFWNFHMELCGNCFWVLSVSF